MGLFNGTNVSVEAILTTRGRELLSKDSGKLNITKFALGDEEIDYTLMIRLIQMEMFPSELLLKIQFQ
tara:strand:- start:89 stop:292 length:204 start_codon:yes stop_codon:yes gene_type:complete